MFDTFKEKKKYCVYYKYLSMIAIVFLVLFLGQLAVAKKLSWNALPMSATLLITYFQSRLLYTMCMD